MRKILKQPLAKFLVGGALNTFLTYAIYLGLRYLMPYQGAYLTAYIVGLIFSYLFNSVIVFETQLSARKFFAYPTVYVVQYILSAVLLEIAVKWLVIPAAYAPLIIIPITIPVTFLLSRLLLNSRAKNKPDTSK